MTRFSVRQRPSVLRVLVRKPNSAQTPHRVCVAVTLKL